MLNLSAIVFLLDNSTMNIKEYIKTKSYPGRILIAGSDLNGKLLLVYAVMGRSLKSRNRILKLSDDELFTKLYDDSGESDDLIIYSAKQRVGNRLLLGNGNHVLLIKEKLLSGSSLIEALADIYPEPDEPNYTPRISLLYDFDTKSYEMAIVRNHDSVERVVWKYTCFDGFCHIIHTYKDDGNPLISFSSDPVLLEVEDTETFVDDFWTSLNNENKVAMYFSDGNTERVINQREVENE